MWLFWGGSNLSPLNFILTNRETQICLGGRLILISVVQRYNDFLNLLVVLCQQYIKINFTPFKIGFEYIRIKIYLKELHKIEL